jgi:hypothetical protein
MWGEGEGEGSRSCLYKLNPLYPLRRELENLLEKGFSFLPETEVERFYTTRTRPRRQGKPL